MSGAGRVVASSYASGDGAFLVEEGIVRASNVNVDSSLTVGGAAHVEDSLTLGSGFVLSPEGMTIDASKHGHALLELKSGASTFEGSLLEIHATSQLASFIKGVVDGITTFDLAATGDLVLNKVRMKSGGVHVVAGGVQVEAGGMRVEGGLTVASGG